MTPEPIDLRIDTPDGRLTVRTAALSDLPAFRELRLQALHDHQVAFAADFEQHKAADEDFWRDYLNFGDSGTIYLAVKDASLVGMTGVRLGRSVKTRHSALIWGVYVRPQWRGHGVGGTLIDACLRWARQRGASIAKLGVARDNQPAIRCYERFGFVTYGIDPRAAFVDGIYHDELLMSRTLEGL